MKQTTDKTKATKDFIYDSARAIFLLSLCACTVLRVVYSPSLSFLYGHFSFCTRVCVCLAFTK